MMKAFINAYKNESTCENLIKLLVHEYKCDLVILSWYVGHGYWYISGIYDSKIDEKINDNQKQGWYLLEIPSKSNIPIRHSRLSIAHTIKSKDALALLGWSTAPESDNFADEKEFIISAFLDKLALEDLLHRQKFRQELMLSNISHSIRTPLNGILHMTKTIVESNGQNGQNTKEAIQYLNQSTVALATNIFDIIDMTKLELGKLTLNKEVFNIRDLIHNTMELAKTLNKSKSITLDSYVDSSVPEYIYSDSKRVKQILINLLENALQHTQKGEIFMYLSATVVNLSLEDSDSGDSLVESSMVVADYQYAITFSVKDTGPGIDPKCRGNLFKPMELLTNSKQQGLSLRISYLLAKALNGTLQLVNSQPGVGSCFEFTLIACEEEPPEKHSRTLKNLKDKQILLIDELNNRVEMCKVFEKYHIKYTIASTFEEVSILHKDKKFNLVVLQTQDIDPLKYTSLFPKIPILIIEDRISRISDYSIGTDYDEQSFKSKLVEIFSGSCRQDSQELRILVVEDEQINRIVIEKLLRQMGYIAITMACNGEEALNIYKRNPNDFDVLLVDIRMPRMSGFELSDAIYKINPKARMIGVTAQIVLEEEVRPWFKDFVYKPIDTKDLQKMLNTTS